MVGRRQLLAGVAGLTAGLAGCAATQDEYSFSSTPGAFAESAVTESGYTGLDREEIEITRRVEVAGSTRDVTVTNYATPYERQVTLAGSERTLAGAAVFTTPSISFVGQEYNPVADQSPKALLERTSEQFAGQLDGGSIEDIQQVDERTLTVLGSDTTVSVFDATTTYQGSEIPVRILVAKVKHDGDFVIVAAAYPKALRSDERPRAERLFENVEHDE